MPVIMTMCGGTVSSSYTCDCCGLPILNIARASALWLEDRAGELAADDVFSIHTSCTRRFQRLIRTDGLQVTRMPLAHLRAGARVDSRYRLAHPVGA